MPNELLWIILLAVSFLFILIAYKFWGRTGLYIWIPVSVVLANVQVLKTIEIFGMTATLGNIVYASGFLVTDILNEKYGRKAALRAVYIGFFSLIAVAVVMNISLLFKPAEGDFAHEPLKTIFSFLPRVGVASLAAYYVSQLHDVWAYRFWMKKLPQDKFLWIRNNASTMVSQLIDTVVFTSCAFIGVFTWQILWSIMISTYILKWVVAVMDTPFLYLAKKMKRRDEESEIRSGPDA
jgi:uncharacterized integral membrane protein (TIGR00697 family)